jgi:hypothetical protein
VCRGATDLGARDGEESSVADPNVLLDVNANGVDTSKAIWT